MSQKKFQQADKILAKLLRSREVEIRKAYILALRAVRVDIALMYERHGPSYVEMKKYNRLYNLEKGITDEIRKMAAKNGLIIKHGVKDAYATSYRTTGWVFESEVRTKLGFGIINPKTIEAVIYNPFDPLKWNDRLREHTRLLDRRIREEITQGLIRGKPYQEMARAIREPFEQGAYRTMRIIQTEAHRCQVQGRLDAFDDARDAGVEFVERWSATLDTKTRDSHQEMDGRTSELVDGEHIFTLPSGDTTRGPGLSGIPEEDINCRCGVVAIIEGFEPTSRRARDPETGKGYLIDRDITYNEWARLKGIKD